MKIDRVFMIILGIAVIYLLFFKKEKMTADANTKKLIQDHYKIDVDAIRNLSKLANDLTKNGKLRVPGGLEVDGGITWHKGKGRLVAHPGNGANIELDNMQGKRGMHMFANFADKGGRLMINDKTGYNGTEILNKKLTCKGDIHWFNGKGKLVANSGDGANIELYNIGDKKGIHMFANHTNKGARILVNDKLGNIKTDIFNKNVSITGGLNIISRNKGITHFNHKNKGENHINGHNFINGLSTSKLHSTKGKIGGYAINGDGTTMLLWEGEWWLASNAEDGAVVNPKRDNVFMNAWTDDRWDLIYLYPGWKIDLWEHNFHGHHRNFENKRKDGLPIRLRTRDMGLDNKVSSYKLSWVGY